MKHGAIREEERVDAGKAYDVATELADALVDAGTDPESTGTSR